MMINTLNIDDSNSLEFKQQVLDLIEFCVSWLHRTGVEVCRDLQTLFHLSTEIGVDLILLSHVRRVEPKSQGVVAHNTTMMSDKVEGGASMPMDLETPVSLVLKIQELSIKLFNEVDSNIFIDPFNLFPY